MMKFFVQKQHFNPLPRKEGDAVDTFKAPVTAEFQSTPS